jgi:VCBS repeat-containing protein
VTITITGQNDAPVAANVSGGVLEHGPAVTVSASYTDPDVGDTHTFLIDTSTDATKRKVTNNRDGTFTYDPNGAFDNVVTSATDKFRYTVTDGSGASSTATVTITIGAQNSPPATADVSAGVLSMARPRRWPPRSPILTAPIPIRSPSIHPQMPPKAA